MTSEKDELSEVSAISPTESKNRNSDGSATRRAAKKKKKHFWLNAAVVAITILIVGCSVFWLVAFTFYVVGSNSMAPTLLATPEERDRLLCWKLAYKYRTPIRWEIAIFQAPTSADAQDIAPGFPTSRESGITVKRIVGLENEQLGIAGGDIWTKPLGDPAPFRRQVKPDSVQQGMWINVYREDFSDVSTEEFLYFWENLSDRNAEVRENRLFIPVGGGIRYLPRSRISYGSRRSMAVMPGIPDRYVLIQKIFFTCDNCGTVFDRVIDNQKIVGRCPSCRLMNTEYSVTYYELRSGLPEIGEHAAGDVPQGDKFHFRFNTYQFVADLKVTMNVRFLNHSSILRTELEGEERVAALTLSPGACLVNDREVAGPATGIVPGEWTRVEFYVADGAVRLYVGEDRKQVFDRLIWNGEKPGTNFEGWKSGITLLAKNGDIEIRDLVIDRDVHYFSGRSQGMLSFLAAMSEDGEIDIPPGHFLPLGDNATVSLDGRSWGAVDMSLLRGVPIYIWSPAHRCRTLLR